MIEQRHAALVGISTGFLVLSVLGFVASALTSTQPPTYTVPILLFAVGLLGLVIAGRTQTRPASSADMPRSLFGVALSAVLAAMIIHGDVFSWFLVALVIVATLLLPRGARDEE